MLNSEDRIEIIVEDESLALGFTQIPNYILKDRSLSDGAKLTYGVLLSYAWQKGHCYPSLETLAQDRGKALRTIKMHTAELRRCKYLKVIRRGRGRTNVYVLLKRKIERPRQDEGDRDDGQKIAPQNNDGQKIAPHNGDEGQKIAPKEDTVFNNITDVLLNKTTGADSSALRADVVVALTDLGISQKVAIRLAKRYKRERILEKIDILKYMQEHHPEKIKKPRGWLRRAIEEDYSAPDGYTSKAEREEEAAGQDRRQQAAARVVAAAEQEAEDLQRQEAEEQANQLAHLQERYGTTQRELTLWPQVLRELELQLPRATYQAWFPQTRLLSLTDGEALIAVPNNFARDWLEQRLAGKILATLAGLALPVERLRFEVLTL
jgi:hypothetical protein